MFIILIVNLNACTKININRKGCKNEAYTELVTDTCYIFVPNIFSPNGDGINDLIKPFCNCEITDYNFEVRKNRRLIFKTNDQSFYWDGTYKDEVSEGILSYKITGKINEIDFGNKGEITSISLFHDNDIVDIESCKTCTFPDQFNEKKTNFTETCQECIPLNQPVEGNFYIGYTNEYGYCR